MAINAFLTESILHNRHSRDSAQKNAYTRRFLLQPKHDKRYYDPSPGIVPRHCRGTGMRYSAKLLFQFRVMIDGQPAKLRYVEERIVVFESPTARAALRKARQRGKREQFSYANSDGNPVHFDFIGVSDLIDLGECEEDEVWYEIKKMVCPMERKSKLIPVEDDLDAIRNEMKK